MNSILCFFLYPWYPDINECETIETGCDGCLNVPGDFRCTSCLAGSFLHEATGRCEDDGGALLYTILFLNGTR